MKTASHALVVVALASPGVSLAQVTDAISREFSVYNDLRGKPVLVTDAVSRELSVFNDLSPQPSQADSISRELSVFNDLREKPVEIVDSISREVSVLNFLSGVIVTSADDASAFPVGGTLPQQLTNLNSAPPAYNAGTWQGVSRRDDNARDAFCSSSEPAPLTRGYVDATLYLAGADEVTYDNTGSAFYRWTFELPCATRFVSLSGTANCDDQGVLWLNGQRITANMLVPACNPTGDPCLPQSCYSQQDYGKDRVDASGLRVLTGPAPDSFEHNSGAFLRLGPGNLNELVFGVAGNAAPLDPTGVEFAVAVLYPVPCPGDADGNRMVDFADVTNVLANFGGAGPAGDANATCAVNFADVTSVLVSFGMVCP